MELEEDDAKLVTPVQEMCGRDTEKQSVTLPDYDMTSKPVIDCTSELEEEFTCAVCFELIVMPTTLNCGHSFCRHCLAHWCEAGKKTECPSCREKFVGLPLENIQIKSSLQKLFPEKYESRRQFIRDSADDAQAIEKFDGVLKKQREDEEIGAASCGFFIGVSLSVILIACVYMVFPGPSNLVAWQSKPLERWMTEDVSNWLEDLGLHSYKDEFDTLAVDGHNLSTIQRDDLERMFYMHNPLHQSKLMEAISAAKSRSHLPADLWQYKAMHEGYTSFLLHSFDRSPRLALLYLYRYDRDSYDFYKQTVLTCNATSATEDRWWFHAGYMISPHIMHLLFVSCFGSLHYWISRFIFVQCICRALLDLITIGRSFSNPRNITCLKMVGEPFFTMLLLYVISYVWWLVPKFVADILFYAEIFCAPIYYIRQLFVQLSQR